MTSAANASPTLDGLFQRVLGRQPEALALVDPSDKQRVTATLPRRWSFAQADRAISALTAHFITYGLPANSVIAVQMPNTVEFVLTLLAAHRAGLIVALLPQLWRQADLTIALNRSGARAIVTSSKIDGVSHADLVMNAAAEAFSIRYVGGFGADLPEGMVSLDDVMAAEFADPITVPADARRAEDGLPATIMPGAHGAPRAVASSSIAGEILITPKGTLGLRGPMVPAVAYAPTSESGNSLLAGKAVDYVDTGFAARLDRSTGALCITAPPSGIMAVGGYRFLSQDLSEWAKRLGSNAMLTALPDRLSGYRLAGRASDNARARDAFTELGLNPLMVEAFRDRPAAE